MKVNFTTEPDDEGVQDALDKTGLNWEWNDKAETWCVPETDFGKLQARMDDLGYEVQEETIL